MLSTATSCPAARDCRAALAMNDKYQLSAQADTQLSETKASSEDFSPGEVTGLLRRLAMTVGVRAGGHPASARREEFIPDGMLRLPPFPFAALRVWAGSAG
jgi:hypothetical protein